ncbi:class F sortase, partial [Amycolatopsis sp. SID8362]|nr:class F sortase [Amycolatopsis sp. SID8362]NED48074.1 class F sortase [Amycolatopsis sp. SID8362]
MAKDAGWRGEDWFVEEWHRGVGWAAVEDEPADDYQSPNASKPRRGRLLVGFALGAATVIAVQLGSSVVASPPVAVVAGTALPAAGAAAP